MKTWLLQWRICFSYVMPYELDDNMKLHGYTSKVSRGTWKWSFPKRSLHFPGVDFSGGVHIIVPKAVKRQRYVTGKEALALQGIWPWSYEGPRAASMNTLVDSPEKETRFLAGNAFSTSVAMAVFLASMCTCSAWFNIAQRHKVVTPHLLALDDASADSASLNKAWKKRGMSKSDVNSTSSTGFLQNEKQTCFEGEDGKTTFADCFLWSFTESLGIQSASQNGDGINILCWEGDWTPQSAENMTVCLKNVKSGINQHWLLVECKVRSLGIGFVSLSKRETVYCNLIW